MSRPRARTVLVSVSAVLLFQLLLWLGVARSALDSHSWPNLVLHSFPSIEAEYLPSCVAVDSSLSTGTPRRLLNAVRAMLEERGVELRIAPPTHSVATGGYLDRDCIEIFSPPSGFEGTNLPLIAVPSVAYYTYDFNGDAVLMLQLGPTWLYLHHWSRWI